MTPKRCALYRHFDADDLLLYLGVSDNPVQRGKDHARDSDWVQYAVRAEVTWYNSRAEAIAAEEQAIKTLRPLFNRQHNDTPQATAARHRYLAKHGDGRWMILLGELVEATMKTYPDCPGVEFRNFVVPLPEDRGLRYPREIKIEIDDEAQAADVTLERDFYVNLCGGVDLAQGVDGASEAFFEFTHAALEKMWSGGRWLAYGFSYVAHDETVKTFVPLSHLGQLVGAINIAERDGDLSALANLTEDLRASTDRESLARVRMALRDDDERVLRHREACKLCVETGGKHVMYDPEDVEFNDLDRIAIYECHSGHWWTSRFPRIRSVETDPASSPVGERLLRQHASNGFVARRRETADR